MTSLTTPETPYHVSLCALPSLVAHLIALKAQLGIALEAVVGVLATQDAVHTLSLVRTLHRLVAKLFAAVTLDRRVFTLVVTRN